MAKNSKNDGADDKPPGEHITFKFPAELDTYRKQIVERAARTKTSPALACRDVIVEHLKAGSVGSGSDPLAEIKEELAALQDIPAIRENYEKGLATIQEELAALREAPKVRESCENEITEIKAEIIALREILEELVVAWAKPPADKDYEVNPNPDSSISTYAFAGRNEVHPHAIVTICREIFGFKSPSVLSLLNGEEQKQLRRFLYYGELPD